MTSRRHAEAQRKDSEKTFFAYVVIAPDDYEDLVKAADEVRLVRSLKDWREGRCIVTTADDLMREATADA